MKAFVLFSFCVLLFSFSKAQIKSTTLPRNVSSNLESEIAPYINYDGNFILYSIENPRKGGWELWFSEKTKSGWTRGQEVVSANKTLNLNSVGGYCVNNEGTEVIFTCKKYGGVGGYDLWSVTRKADGRWNEPQNFGKPVNSSKNEANPNLTLDGKKLYFMVCDAIKAGQSECCQIYTSEKKGNMWGAPQKLEASWNSCVSTPRISPDEKTIYFSTAKNSSSLDLYVSHFENGKWGTPIAMKEFNTDLDDQFISFSLAAKYVYFAKKDEKWNLYIGEMPEEYRFNQLNLFQGRTQTPDGSGVASKVVMVNAEDPEHVDLNLSDANGYFNFYLPTGDYTMYYENRDADKMFVLDTLVFSKEEEFERERKKITMESFAKGKTVETSFAEDERIMLLQLKYLAGISKSKGVNLEVDYPESLTEAQKTKLKEWADHFEQVTLNEIEESEGSNSVKIKIN